MKKVFYHITLENDSPIHIGNGGNNYTDMDLIKDSQGCFFIPGTSFSGPIMHYINEELFQPKMSNGEFKQSPVYISDFRMEEFTNNVEVRDGVQLDNKIAVDGHKYDFEIIPAGHRFVGIIEIMDRDDQEYETELERALKAIHSGRIRFGYKTSRGLGKLKIIQAKKRIFTEDNIEDFFHFDPEEVSQYSVEIKLDEDSYEGIQLSVTLEQDGGLCIRTYNTMKGEADFRHIHSGGKPVIPGTSWNGLMRSEFTKNIKKFNLSLDADDLFGYIDGTDKKKSKIRIDESIITGGKTVELTRNSIDPFYAGAKDGALFKGEYYYSGDTELNVSIPAIETDGLSEQELREFRMLFMLFLKDLDMGFIALGGETSTGKGLFKVKEIQENGNPISIEKYLEVQG